jgi:hypothetical protein
MSSSDPLEGGCLCGALRYRCNAPPTDVGYCHCRLCQRSSGAPVLVWASIPVDHFSYETGDPAIYRSSSTGQREFCATCGTQIAFRGQGRPAEVDINVGSLDDPSSVKPRRHIWTASRIPWFKTADDLPCSEHGEPESG